MRVQRRKWKVLSFKYYISVIAGRGGRDQVWNQHAEEVQQSQEHRHLLWSIHQETASWHRRPALGRTPFFNVMNVIFLVLSYFYHLSNSFFGSPGKDDLKGLEERQFSPPGLKRNGKIFSLFIEWWKRNPTWRKNLLTEAQVSIFCVFLIANRATLHVFLLHLRKLEYTEKRKKDFPCSLHSLGRDHLVSWVLYYIFFSLAPPRGPPEVDMRGFSTQ